MRYALHIQNLNGKVTTRFFNDYDEPLYICKELINKARNKEIYIHAVVLVDNVELKPLISRIF